MPSYYGTLAEALTYHTDRGNADWAAAASDALRTAALVRATTWLDATYGSRFPGVRTDGRNQELQWPRSGAVDSEDWSIPYDEVPIEVKRATFEAALRELAAPGSLSPDYVASERVKREKVGPLETEYVDSGGGAGDARPVLSIVDDLLFTLLSGSKDSVSLFGVSDRA